LLEPYDWKLSRTVLRGERGSNAPDLPGKKAVSTKLVLISFNTIGIPQPFISVLSEEQLVHAISTN